MDCLLNYFYRWNIEFHWELPEFMGAIVETREMHLSLQGWFAICLVPPGTHDTMTVGSKYLMSDSYLYAGVLVPTSLLSLASFPRIFFLIDCFFTILLLIWGFCQFARCLKDCADPPTNFCTSCFPECPQQLCPCPPFLTHEPTFVSHPSAPNTGFGREQNAQFCV